MKKAFIEMKCDAPNCDSKLVLPLGRDGQAYIAPEQQEEVDRWTSIQRNDGSLFDYCRQVCLLNGARLLEPVNRTSVPDMKKIISLGQDDSPSMTGSGLIIP